jgi:large subunit ribosomal protein L21
MYAIFHAKGKQWRAEPGATLKLPSLDAEPGDRVTFDRVLLASREGEILIGRPSLEGASVSTEVLRHGKGDKVIVFKRKKRKNYRRKQGHRQSFTEVEIVDIDLDGVAAPSADDADVEAEEAPEEVEAAVEVEEEAAAEAEEEVVEEAADEAVEEDQDEAPEIDITPAAAELAEEHDLDLTSIEGTGKDGRILKSDVQGAIKELEEE